MWAMKLCLSILAVISCCEASKILVVFPLPGKSHAILGDGIVRHLLNAGHEVTYISPFPYKPESPKLHWVDISDNFKAMPEEMMNINAIMEKKVDFGDHMALFHVMTNIGRATVENPNVQKLMNDPKQEFDLVIVEWLFSEVTIGFAAVFNCPYIWSSSLDVHWHVLHLIDQPLNPAYSSDAISTNLPPFNFWQRVSELYTQLKVQYYRYMYTNAIEGQIYQELFGPYIVKRGRTPPPYDVLHYNGSLILGNSHVSLGQPAPIPQNYIPICGYHIDDEVKPLPQDLKKLLDNAKNGVIYFSMGSNLKSKDIPMQIKTSLLKMFGELKYTVLWKFEEDLPNRPTNVHILKWAPQQGILSHPNTILFITHGGLLSTTETIHFGKPIIGIPAFGDQFINVVRAVQKGFALQVDLSYTMADDLKIAINKMTTNPKYAEKAKELSFIYHDRPEKPGKLLAHYVKHVIETKGAPHLRSPALHVPFYQKLYLDLLAVVLVCLFVLVRLLKLVYCAFCSSKNVQDKKKTN
ncbi:UDP-glucosyltransferase 2-like [Anticarsia gemmatalis]|uniref:UDP-glucosyltransferase 2-like n=1 Tax=Anticarsia gemmatalis TaxID=129554 RepID=UPI003F75A466